MNNFLFKKTGSKFTILFVTALFLSFSFVSAVNIGNSSITGVSIVYPSTTGSGSSSSANVTSVTGLSPITASPTTGDVVISIDTSQFCLANGTGCMSTPVFNDSYVPYQGANKDVNLTGQVTIMERLGLGNTNPTSANLIMGTVTGPDVTNTFNVANTYNGTQAAMRGVLFTVNHNGTSPTPTVTGNQISALLQQNPGRSSTITGSLITTGLNSAQIINSTNNSQNIFRAYTANLNANTKNHTNTSFYIAGYYVAPFTPYLGFNLTQLIWGGLINEDWQINTDNRLILEGNDTLKGDTYLIFNSTLNATLNYYHGNLIYRIAQNITVNTSIIPISNNSFDLGNSSNRWRNGFIFNLTTGDINFANGLVLKERDSDMCFYNMSSGSLLSCLNGDGSVYQNTTGTQPTCNQANRGKQWIVYGGAGVADSMQVCLKTVLDNYLWVGL